MSSKPTLRDIAEATGVSTASVSMILNGKSLERFSSQRVASVLAEAERIGYRTPSARCAGKQIAILSPSVSNPYHTMMISGIDAAAHAAGYHTAIYNTYWNPRTESHLLDSLDYSRVAGIIFAMTPIQTAKVRELSRRVPIVAVGDRVTDCGIDTVDVDNFGAAQLVAKHLIDLGHTRIAYLSTALNEHHISRMRRAQGLQEAYRMWCPEGSVTICSHVNSLEAEISTPDLEYRSGMELAYKCLRNDKITGIVAINDMVAFGVLDALQRYTLSDSLLEAALAQPDQPEQALEHRARRLQGSGLLPMAGFGECLQHELIEPLPDVLQRYQQLLALWPTPLNSALPVSFEGHGLMLEGWLSNLHQRNDNGLLSITTIPNSIGAIKTRKWHRLTRSWVNHLVACASGLDMSTALVASDDTLLLEPLDTKQAREILGNLLTAWKVGMSHPLPVAVKTAFAWLAQTDPAKADAAAQKAYEGDGQTSDGERRESAALARQFPDYAALMAGDEFEEWCDALYRPLFDAPWRSLNSEASR